MDFFGNSSGPIASLETYMYRRYGQGIRYEFEK